MNNLSGKIKLYISLGIVFSIILVSFSIIFYGVYQVYYDPASLFRHDFGSGGDIEEYFDERVVNVAVMGLHNRREDNTFGEVYFVDTILITSVNFDRDSVTMLAVPRDSYVEIAHAGDKDRIRQSYSYGFDAAEEEGLDEQHAEGMRYAVDTIGGLWDEIELHYYIAMDIQGLEQLVNSLGGVYYNVERDMIGPTPRESLEAGPQMLDGRGYLTYLTYREEDARDDLNRMERQKSLLLATFDYFQEMGLFRYVIPTYAAYREHVRTDLNFNQVTALTLFAGERLEADAIYDYSLQGEYFTRDDDDTYYLALDESSKQDLVEKLINPNGR